MSLFGQLLGGEKRALTGRDVDMLLDGFGGNESLTGQRVTPEKSLGNSAVTQAVQVIGATASTLPLILYERQGDDRTRATKHRLWPTLHDQPNPEMSAGVFLRTQYQNKLLRGARYAEIEFNGAGQPLWLWHLPSQLVTPGRYYKRLGGGLTVDPSQANPEDRRRGGTLLFEVKSAGGGSVYLEPERVFYVPDHLSWDGVTPCSRLKAALEPIALGLAAQDTAAALLGNDATPGGVIRRPTDAPALTPTGERNRIAAWEAAHGGRKKKGRVAILQEGEEYQQVTLSPTDSRLIEFLNLGMLQVAQIFNLPPYFLGATQANEPYSNVEAEWQKLASQTLAPHLVDDQQEVRRKLLTDSERAAGYFAEYELKALLKADANTRATIYRQLIEGGVVTPNYVARAENLPPIPADQGGDTYRAARSFGAAGQVLTEPSLPASQMPPQTPPAK